MKRKREKQKVKKWVGKMKVKTEICNSMTFAIAIKCALKRGCSKTYRKSIFGKAEKCWVIVGGIYAPCLPSTLQNNQNTQKKTKNKEQFQVIIILITSNKTLIFTKSDKKFIKHNQDWKQEIRTFDQINGMNVCIKIFDIFSGIQKYFVKNNIVIHQWSVSYTLSSKGAHRWFDLQEYSFRSTRFTNSA